MIRNDVTMVSFELPKSLLALVTLAASEAGVSRSQLLREASRREALNILRAQAPAENPALAEQGT